MRALRGSTTLLICLVLLSCNNKRVEEYAGIPPNDRIAKPAGVVIEALERFHKDHTQYPKQLSDLVPQYCTSIPNPEYGRKEWKYLPSDNYYTLEALLEEDNYIGYYYFSDSKEWTYDE
jgi:hypothetical protein